MTPSAQVYLVTGVTDMRKSIDGLSLIVAQHLEMDPFSESWFIFVIVIEINSKSCFGTLMAFGFIIGG